MRIKINKLPWQIFLLIGILIILDISIHPLTNGPDRLIHDPAVYRLWDPNYLPNDWYIGMAIKSKVYLFYAQLINAYRLIGISEEHWRQGLYLLSLAVLYYSIISIGKLLTKSIYFAPVLAILHSLFSIGRFQPVWLYGPFIQIDGGLAPRSIGVAASFLALYYLLKNSILLPALILGLATLIHVSNSLIVFSLFLMVWIVYNLIFTKEKFRKIVKVSLGSVIIYLISGGWFVLYTYWQDRGSTTALSDHQFIWTWTNLRAAYMALPFAGIYWWQLYLYSTVIILGWLFLRKKIKPSSLAEINILMLVGAGSIVYFYLFYYFAFVKPWLPAFQFYSLRVNYFSHFVTYAFIILLITIAISKMPRKNWLPLSAVVIFLFMLLATYTVLPDVFFTQKPKLNNLKSSWKKIVQPRLTPKESLISTYQFVLDHPQPFLGPPDWNHSGYYLPNIVSFKSFGFTKEGLSEWYNRLNDVSLGKIQEYYETQKNNNYFRPPEPDWKIIYSRLKKDDVLGLAQKYNFNLFVTYNNLDYPFKLISEDNEFKLYQLSE